MNSALSREDWLTQASSLILLEIIAQHHTLDDTHKFSVSIGFPDGIKSKAIACCWRKEASTDGSNAIFVSPVINNSIQILEALTHELVHYTDNCVSGHRNHFAKLARKIGLAGKLTATYANDDLKGQLLSVVECLGEIPHAPITPSLASTKPVRKSAIKVSCNNPECYAIFRIAEMHADKIHENSHCPCCDYTGLTVE